MTTGSGSGSSQDPATAATGDAADRPIQPTGAARSSPPLEPAHTTADKQAPATAAAATGASAAAASASWEAEIEDTLKLVALLPPSVRGALEGHPRLYELVEVVMDLGRPPVARFVAGDERISSASVTADDLQYAVDQVGHFGGDNRAGIDATLHRISAMRNRAGRIVGLTCRVGRAVLGSAELVRDLAVSGASILFLGRPGVGKTTAIRELSRLLADDLVKRVVIVDTSNEIGGDGDVPHPGIGRARRMQVPDPELQHRVMIEAVENHMPEVVVIDEIGTEAECAAARTIAQRGVQLVATAHGNELQNLIKNPALSDLVGGIQSVTLGDDEAKRRGVQKSILERGAPPTFDVAVEMLERGRWHVHPDVAAAVDALLAGGSAGGQMRERAPDGTVLRYNQSPSLRPAPGGGAGASSGVKSALPELPKGPGGGVAGGVDDGLQRPSARAGGAGGGSSFARRSLFTYDRQEPAAAGGGASVTRRGRTVQLGTADPDVALLRVHVADLDDERLWEVMTAMALHDKVYLSPSPAGADAVLALRTRLKSNGALRAAARAAGVPIYALKTGSSGNLVRAFRTLLGVESSAGGVFGSAAGSGAAAAAAAAAGPVLSSSGSVVSGSWDSEDAASALFGGLGFDDEGGGGSGGGSYSDGDDADAVAEAVGAAAGGVGGAGGGVRREESEALEEARLAVEQLVLPLQQPVELLPRSAGARAAQEAMLRRYRLPWEVVGEGGDARLRVLPSPGAAGGAAAGGDVEVVVQGAARSQ